MFLNSEELSLGVSDVAVGLTASGRTSVQILKDVCRSITGTPEDYCLPFGTTGACFLCIYICTYVCLYISTHIHITSYSFSV